MMQSQGVKSYSVHRGVDDRNSVLVHMEFADRGAVEAFETWYGPMSAEWMKEHPGSEHEIVDRWVGDDVPGYAREGLS